MKWVNRVHGESLVTEIREVHPNKKMRQSIYLSVVNIHQTELGITNSDRILKSRESCDPTTRGAGVRMQSVSPTRTTCHNDPDVPNTTFTYIYVLYAEYFPLSGCRQSM
jgi:hypothetical protein